VTALLLGLGALSVSFGVAMVVGRFIRAGEDAHEARMRGLWRHAADDPP